MMQKYSDEYEDVHERQTFLLKENVEYFGKRYLGNLTSEVAFEIFFRIKNLSELVNHSLTTNF